MTVARSAWSSRNREEVADEAGSEVVVVVVVVLEAEVDVAVSCDVIFKE